MTKPNANINVKIIPIVVSSLSLELFFTYPIINIVKKPDPNAPIIKGIFKIGYFKSGNGIKLMKNNFETYNLKIKSFSHF